MLHLANIDIVRAVAVLAVLAHHTFVATGFRIPYLDQAGGLVGVQLFFILSGYLISESATKHGPRAYALHRLFRIFPAYWVAMLLVGTASPLTWSWVADRPLALLLSALNLQQLYAVALLELDILHVTWTLTVEVIWYLLAPLAIMAFRQFAWPAFILLIGLSVGWSLLASHHLMGPLYEPGFAAMTQPLVAGQYEVLVGAAFPAQLVFFGMGALVYRYRASLDRLSNTALWGCMVLCIPVLGLLGAYGTSPPIPLGIGLTAFFILMLRAPALPLPGLAHLGKISYSVYLFHFPIILWCHSRWGHLGAIHLLASVLLVLGVSHIVHAVVERPAMSLARRLSMRGALSVHGPSTRLPTA